MPGGAPKRVLNFSANRNWATRIVGPTDQEPTISPTNMAAQAPTTKCRDPICHRWPTWAPQSKKQKIPLSSSLPSVLILGCWMVDQTGPTSHGSHFSKLPHHVRPDDRTRSVIGSSSVSDQYRLMPKLFFPLKHALCWSSFKMMAQTRSAVYGSSLCWSTVLIMHQWGPPGSHS